MTEKQKRRPHIAALVLVILATACGSVPDQKVREAVQANAQAGKALFEEKCKTVAGEKIYRTVPDVEGVLLMKVRPRIGEKELADPMWPGAAFAREARTDEYITTFLGYEHAASYDKPVSKTDRGYIGTNYQPNNPSNLPGYRFVDVIDEKDGKRYRYTGYQKAVGKKDVIAPNVQLELRKDPNYDLNVYRYVLDKTLAAAAPRYGVTYEDHVIPEERALGVASSTVKVIDLQTNEVLGEMIRYAWRPRGIQATAWLTASRCPDHAVGTSEATRKFVDQILIPKKEQ